MPNDSQTNYAQYADAVNAALRVLEQNKTILLASRWEQRDMASALSQAVTKLKEEIERLPKIKENLLSLDQFNSAFKAHFLSRTNGVIAACQKLSNIVSIPDFQRFDAIQQTSSIIGDSPEFEMFDQFRFGETNFVLFGKNGAGKTTLLNRVQNRLIQMNSFVLPATRNINYNNGVYCQPSLISFESAIQKSKGEEGFYYLSQLLIHKENEQHRNREEDTVVRIATRLFDSMGTERKLIIDPAGTLMLATDEGVQYLLSEGSDGEKTAVFFLLIALLAPKDAFILIDEPENHLNGALMVNLFDALEEQRKDLKFVYATHNIHFIESRTNVQLIYLEKTKKKNEWAFRPMKNFEDIPVDLILKMEGTNNDILFCEGEDDASRDSKLYKILFPNHQVIASQGCEKVILQTQIVNKNSRLLRKKAFGIIDNDFRNADDIERLNEKSIRVLTANEIENVFLLEPCLESMKRHCSIEEDVETIKEKVIGLVVNKQKEILIDFATKEFRSLRRANKFTNADDIENELRQINEKNDGAFLERFGLFKDRLDSAIQRKAYSELMMYVPGKKLLKDVAKIFKLLDDKEYVRQALLIIGKENNLAKELKEAIIRRPHSSSANL